jgi:hypothetical protein
MESGEDSYEVTCDICGVIGAEIVHVHMCYSPNPELTGEFTLLLCKDCVFDWMASSFELPS